MSKEELVAAIVDMREEDAVRLTQEMLDGGTDPMTIMDAAREGMEAVGKAYEQGEAFLPELIMSGEMLTEISTIVKPKLQEGATGEKIGKVVFGTVAGDIHDIAKDIVVFMLDINGFEVIDLGVDVPVQSFVDAVKDSGANIVGLSGFLTLAFDPMKETVAALRDGGYDVKVMIGGGQIDEQVREYTGADAYGKDAMAAVALAKDWAAA